jgi:hypothetical protein
MKKVALLFDMSISTFIPDAIIIFSISLLASIVILRVNVELFYKITSLSGGKIENEPVAGEMK